MKTLKQRQRETGRTLALDGAAWRRLRATVLREQPLCAVCRTEWATDCDHINNDPTDNRRENLQGLCHECHSRKTAGDMGRTVRWGCDADGRPLDPGHPWNR
jgi:5-methylcytosine-specific restriction endonuclease McrA